ncbi:hypothetical protein ILUMI_11086 [Ignelater luminosus]|uniref:Uncharacterized protein n=1 Tax=Ignelater luminosus TaxID=2038154 RepID=A0A8K0D2R3_IGNLU|nr:hypothetical protein ILUMI_11086 [Ignelater luminosus]
MEFEKANILLLLITETRVKGKGLRITDTVYSGVEVQSWGQSGVACLVHRDCMDNVNIWKLVNERIMSMQFKIGGEELVTVVVESDSKSKKQEFWLTLQELVEKTKVC